MTDHQCNIALTCWASTQWGSDILPYTNQRPKHMYTTLTYHKEFRKSGKSSSNAPRLEQSVQLVYDFQTAIDNPPPTVINSRHNILFGGHHDGPAMTMHWKSQDRNSIARISKFDYKIPNNESCILPFWVKNSFSVLPLMTSGGHIERKCLSKKANRCAWT